MPIIFEILVALNVKIGPLSVFRYHVWFIQYRHFLYYAFRKFCQDKNFSYLIFKYVVFILLAFSLTKYLQDAYPMENNNPVAMRKTMSNTANAIKMRANASRSCNLRNILRIYFLKASRINWIKLKLNDSIVYLNFFCSTQHKYWDHIPNQSNRQSQRLHKEVHKWHKETYKWHYDVDRFQAWKKIWINISSVEKRANIRFITDVFSLFAFYRCIIEQLHAEKKISSEITFNYRKQSFWYRILLHFVPGYTNHVRAVILIFDTKVIIFTDMNKNFTLRKIQW